MSRHPYTPIGSRGFTVAVKSLTDMRLAYRATCKTCGVGGAWLTDRAAVEKNAQAHQDSEHGSQEEAA